MDLTIRLLTGQEISLSIHATTTVLEAKRKLVETLKWDTNADDTRLILEGCSLNDAETIMRLNPQRHPCLQFVRVLTKDTQTKPEPTELKEH